MKNFIFCAMGSCVMLSDLELTLTMNVKVVTNVENMLERSFKKIKLILKRIKNFKSHCFHTYIASAIIHYSDTVLSILRLAPQTNRLRQPSQYLLVQSQQW